MEPFRLKLKIGNHEFEAEGPEEAVKEQFAIWRDLIASPSASPPTVASPPPPPDPTVVSLSGTGRATPARGNGTLTVLATEDRETYAKIFKHEGRVVSLTVPTPAGVNQHADALLALMLGQMIYNADDQVTGQQLSDGMKMSGLRVDRVDRSWGINKSYILTTGENRGMRYRLNNQGLVRAREIADDLLSQVP